MSKLILAAQSNSNSPFDEIRRVDEHGSEYWMARDLQKMLGYKTWQKFSDAIDRAKSTCLLNGELEASHINHLPGSVSAEGRTGDDYRLSRNACYWDPEYEWSGKELRALQGRLFVPAEATT
jgi:DNA-damage-inducible protein D